VTFTINMRQVVYQATHLACNSLVGDSDNYFVLGDIIEYPSETEKFYSSILLKIDRTSLTVNYVSFQHLASSFYSTHSLVLIDSKLLFLGITNQMEDVNLQSQAPYLMRYSF